MLGDTQGTEKLFKDLKRKEQSFFDALKEETVIVNKHLGEGETEEDMFAAVERNVFFRINLNKAIELYYPINNEIVKRVFWERKGGIEEKKNLYV